MIEGDDCMSTKNWERRNLVEASKSLLKDNYWRLVGVVFVCNVFTILANLPNNTEEDSSWFISLLVFALLFFIVSPLSCGKVRTFLLGFQEDRVETANAFYYFSHDYWNVVKILFIMYLKIVLWSLLFIIPGFVKAYEYRMIPYILAEQPDISCADAFARTKEMTQNQKMNMFVLDLSFIGWNLLGIITVIGSIFINPYIEGVYAALYLELKKNG